MGTTPRGFPYPAATAAPDVPADLQALAEAIDDEFDDTGIWTTFVASLSAVTTPPNLGTGPTNAGRYCRIGNLVIGFGNIVFGTGGSVAAGTGNYLLALPVNAKLTTTSTPIGRARISDSSASAVGFLDLCVQTDGDDVAFIRYSAAFPTGTLTTVNHNTPWTWATLDSLTYWFCYEAS